MTRAFALLLNGCFIVAVPHTETTVIAAHVDGRFALPAGRLELTAHVFGNIVLASVQRPRTCYLVERGTIEIERHLEAEVHMLDPGSTGDPSTLRDLVLGMELLVSAVSGAVSGLVTGVALIIDHGGSTTRATHVVGYPTSVCPVAVPDIAIEIAFPSGEVARGTSNAGGVVTAPIPVGAGTIVVRGAGLEARITR